MTDHNRGAYTPQSDAPLAFDARRTRGGGDRPFPLALIISAVILVVIVAALVIFLMRQPDGSETAKEGGEVIDAMKSPPLETVTPVEPAPGMQVSVEDPLVPPSFTPPPEHPALRPAAPAAAPADPGGALIHKTPPAPAPAAAPPAVAKAPAPAAPPAAPKAPAAPGGGAQVQIGAFSSAALAEKGWSDIARIFPGAMAGKTKRVETVDSNGSTLHRTFIGGFASREEAQNFCEVLKGQGRQCFVR